MLKSISNRGIIDTLIPPKSINALHDYPSTSLQHPCIFVTVHKSVLFLVHTTLFPLDVCLRLKTWNQSLFLIFLLAIIDFRCLSSYWVMLLGHNYIYAYLITASPYHTKDTTVQTQKQDAMYL